MVVAGMVNIAQFSSFRAGWGGCAEACPIRTVKRVPVVRIWGYSPQFRPA